MTSLPAALRRGADRYDVLLLLVIGALVVAPFEWTPLRVLIVVLLTLIFLFALWTANAPPRLFSVATALAAVALITGAVAQTSNGRVPRAIFASVSVLLCIATIASIVARLAPRVQVTTRTLAASVAIFLLIGLLFAFVFSLIAAIRNFGFFAQPGPHDSVSYLYFSFVTLTTVGFGDLTAGNDAGRMLTVMEALLGQLYLVTVVAVVVGNRSRQ